MVAFSNSDTISHFCIESQIWEEQSVVKPCVPILDSENMITIDAMQRICNLESEDMTSRPVNMGKDYIPLLSLSFPM